MRGYVRVSRFVKRIFWENYSNFGVRGIKCYGVEEESEVSRSLIVIEFFVLS